MRIILMVLCLLLTAKPSSALSVEWRSPATYVKISTLIAIGTVGPVHETVSPEGILVVSATVKIEKVIFWRFAAEEKAPAEIVLYHVDPNNGIVVGSLHIGKNYEGRCFLMLEMNGINKFRPIDQVGVQKLEKEELLWPTERGKIEQVPLQRVIDELKALRK